jgi:RHS repeat-associated protein
LAQAVSESFGLDPTGDRLVFERENPYLLRESTVGNRFGFHGRPVDGETGLGFFRNRYFDSGMGRFLTSDPMGYVDGPSMYAYGGNDPVNFSDPMGLNKWDCQFEGEGACELEQAGLDLMARKKVEAEANALLTEQALLLSYFRSQQTPRGEWREVAREIYRAETGTALGAEAKLKYVMGPAGCDTREIGCNLTGLAESAELLETALGVALAIVGPESLLAEEATTLNVMVRRNPAKLKALTNHEKGNVGTAWSRLAALSRGETIVGEEIDLIFKINGREVPVRPDLLVRTPEGQLVYIESKFSSSASFTKGQRTVIPELVRAGEEGLTATVGSRSGRLRTGDKVRVQFQGDIWDAGPSLTGGG